ncbi:Cytochrome b5 [Habropoda laboriosa]|uniref:Cytochrome b5 n=1 Tax=Habropoda laboriosa TaxID=597456 RepID=A0A0L7R5Q3_9HYME|nr:PREDICTED: cytochrome b5-like [Habropoda laboriosa]KOC66144.1 Cytochrome b5 [Habropoda laboriosa]
MSKQFTKSEVAKYSTKDKTLIILHDKVYDVTDFLNEHPGGEEILLDHSGKDSSEDFDDIGHSSDAFDLMKKYLVGELVHEEKTYKTPKQSWSTSYGKNETNKKNEGMSPTIMLAGLMILLAAAYFLYL